ncbi:hypothetical protein NEA10_13935 [Phormidium yuhuli AB48]|uniref:Tetratricopeptide repeat protein n=1 Tax=Phormidium yuhuli AB48 TaxID=2940671 RepID=A0ABY5ANY1_9CYAN|nr:tetratricopeptide repeat protein [Phormidium yuhuli]USR89949.1 hypothetical protein NEA10_13935 [Phormidium yuhuli AB48]
MEIQQFFGFFLLLAIALGGMGVMVWAYVGSGSQAVLFPNPVPSQPPGAEAFQAGCEAFEQGHYAAAIAAFERELRSHPKSAEAYHNRGLAFANLRQDDKAVENLLKASQEYAEADRPEGLAQIQEQLEALKARKLAQSS